MKNVHLLPTDKSSRIRIGDNGNFVIGLTQNSIRSRNDSFTNQHIYITSDEEIKEGLNQWYLDKFLNKPRNSSGSQYGEKQDVIILTTDQDLIADGVQAIDDEFLEWFVKNPSCEEVEVKRNKKLSNKSIWDAVEGDLVFNNHNCGGVITQLSNDIRVHIISENGEGYMETAITSDNGLDTLVINNYKVYEYSDYKIIIPKEEPKYPIGGYAPGYYGCTCVTCKTEFMGDKRAVQCEPCAIKMTKEEPKQETLEDIKLEEVFGSNYCQFSVIENKLAILYRNQEQLLKAIKLLSNETRNT